MTVKLLKRTGIRLVLEAYRVAWLLQGLA